MVVIVPMECTGTLTLRNVFHKPNVLVTVMVSLTHMEVRDSESVKNGMVLFYLRPID